MEQQLKILKDEGKIISYEVSKEIALQSLLN